MFCVCKHSSNQLSVYFSFCFLLFFLFLCLIFVFLFVLFFKKKHKYQILCVKIQKEKNSFSLPKKKYILLWFFCVLCLSNVEWHFMKYFFIFIIFFCSFWLRWCGVWFGSVRASVCVSLSFFYFLECHLCWCIQKWNCYMRFFNFLNVGGQILQQA